jgi:hypothetical protein
MEAWMRKAIAQANAFTISWAKNHRDDDEIAGAAVQLPQLL